MYPILISFRFFLGCSLTHESPTREPAFDVRFGHAGALQSLYPALLLGEL